MFCFPSIFLTLPTTGNILARPFCLRRKKQKTKVPCGGGSVSGGAAFFLKKESGECIGPPSTRHTRLVSCWILFSSRPRYARVTMACSRSPPAHALGAPRDGAAAQNPRRTLRPVGASGGQCVCFFLHKVICHHIWPGPVLFFQTGGSKRGARRWQWRRQGPDAIDREEQDPMDAHGVRWNAACGVRRAACGVRRVVTDGRTAWRPPRWR